MIAILSGVVTIESIYVGASLFIFIGLIIYNCWYKKTVNIVDIEKKSF